MGKDREQPDATRMKAQALRQEQERKEKRVRLIVFLTVGLLVLATVVGTVFAVLNSREEEPAPGQPQASPTAGSNAEQTAWIVSNQGAGKENPNAVTIDEYFDYSCHACADHESLLADQVDQGLKDGRINIRYIPVNVVNMEWHPVASAASAVVYDKQPDAFLQFHHQLLNFFKSQFDKGDGTIIKDTAKSLDQVKEIARQVGVSDEVIAQFDQANVDAMLTDNTEAWKARKVVGRDSLGTPEYVVNDTRFTLTKENVNTFVDAVESAAKESQ